MITKKPGAFPEVRKSGPGWIVGIFLLFSFSTSELSVRFAMMKKEDGKSKIMQDHDHLYTDCSWTFLSNHAHVLICLHKDPMLRLRDVADMVGISTRAVQSIVYDLEGAGILSHEKIGRRNRYQIHSQNGLRHPLTSDCEVSDFLQLVSGKKLYS